LSSEAPTIFFFGSAWFSLVLSLSTYFTMFESICSLPLSSDLFSQAIHPREPVVAVGLAAGHVQTFRLPSDEADDEDDAGSCSSSHGRGHIDTMWKTRRHKGSCRCLAYGVDGETLYSAGTDGLIKAANSETGKVTNKIAIPLEKNGYEPALSLCMQLDTFHLTMLAFSAPSMRPP
jgi:hypothetical protein